MRGSSRPNVRPAKESYKKTTADFIRDTNELLGKQYLKTGKPRGTIGDLCDFCHKNIYVKRIAMGLRRYKGWRFSCKKCWHEKGFVHGKDKIWQSDQEWDTPPSRWGKPLTSSE